MQWNTRESGGVHVTEESEKAASSYTLGYLSLAQYVIGRLEYMDLCKGFIFIVLQLEEQMIEIKTNQEFEVNNVLSFRGKILSNELDSIGKDMEAKISAFGAKRVGNPITATYAIEGNLVDIEILLPIDKNIGKIDKYCFKEKIKIVNAVEALYKGNPMGLQNACNELNQYILENNLQPVTVGYNVTKYVDPINLENTEIHIYVGINPNIL